MFTHFTGNFTIGNHFLVFILLFFSAIQVYSRSPDRELERTAVDFIRKNFQYKEFNPVHGEETARVNEIFSSALANFGKKNYTSDHIASVFTLLYDNSTYSYEDGVDSVRMPMRMSLCFAAIALMSDSERALTYIELAQFSLIDRHCQRVIDGLEEYYLALLILKLYFLYTYGWITEHEIKQVERYAVENRHRIRKEYFEEVIALLELFSRHMGYV